MSVEQFRIRMDRDYVYIHSQLEGYKGRRYRVDCFGMFMPVQQPAVVVKCVKPSTIDRTVVCSEGQFTTLFQEIEVPTPPPEPIPEKIAGTSNPNWGRV